jgi:hypothetical protein
MASNSENLTSRCFKLLLLLHFAVAAMSSIDLLTALPGAVASPVLKGRKGQLGHVWATKNIFAQGRRRAAIVHFART